MKPIIPGRDPGVTGHAGGWIMHDEQPRPRGSIASLCAEPEHRIGADPMQLDLWSALQPGHNTLEAATDPHPRAFISKSQPTPAPAQGAQPRPLLVDPLGAPQAASSIDHTITPPVRDGLAAAMPSAAAPWLHPALVTGALVVALGVGWLGGASPSFFFAPAAAPAPQANSSGCAREPGKDPACASAKADRERAPSAPIPVKLATPGAAPQRPREPARPAQQASAAVNKDVSTTNAISAGSTERSKILPRPAPATETRPTTIEGWTIREVVGGTVVLDGPTGAFRAAQGDSVPGIGRIESVVRWGNRWIVATTRGLISTQN